MAIGVPQLNAPLAAEAMERERLRAEGADLYAETLGPPIGAQPQIGPSPEEIANVRRLALEAATVAGGQRRKAEGAAGRERSQAFGEAVSGLARLAEQGRLHADKILAGQMAESKGQRDLDIAEAKLLVSLVGRQMLAESMTERAKIGAGARVTGARIAAAGREPPPPEDKLLPLLDAQIRALENMLRGTETTTRIQRETVTPEEITETATVPLTGE